MNKCLILMCFTIIIIRGEESKTIEEFKQSNILFTSKIFKELISTNPENVVVCPFSIETVLAMIHAGAGGNTAREIAAGADLPDDTTKVQSFFHVLKTNENQSYTLKSVNKLYLANRFTIKDDYKATVQHVFKAEIENINFNENKKAAHVMNDWVESQTQNKIKDLIKDDYLGSDTVSVLINALYFKAEWLNPFDSMHTKRSNFHVNRGKQVEVEMMHTVLDANFHINNEIRAKFLELPYQNEDITMTFVLPFETDGFSQLEDIMEEVLKRQPFGEQHQITIAIPKFKMETSISLEPLLENLGIKEAFSRAANFSAMTASDGVFLTHVEQKAFIEVTERGTTAGAATFAISEDRSFGSRFIADRPFIFMLRHNINGILFVGKFVNPIGTMVSE